MPKKAKIFLYDYIGSGSITAADIAAQITNAQDQGVTDFEVRINSMGGDAFQGVALYNILKTLNPTVYIDGVAASAASVVAMAGSKVFMAKNAMLMIHNPSTWVGGEEKDLDKAKEILVKMKESIISAYKSKTGKEDDDLINLMDEETWFNAEEALENKFIDEIFEQDLNQKEYVAVFCSFENSKTKSKDKKMNKEILAFFGLAETATEAEVTAKLKGLRTELGLPENAGITEIMAKIKESVEPVTPETAKVPAATAKTAEQKVDDFIQAQNQAKAETLVDDAIKAGKILPADKDIFLQAAVSDYAKCKTNIDARKAGMVLPGKTKIDNSNTNVDDKKVDPVKAAADAFRESGRVPLVKG